MIEMLLGVSAVVLAIALLARRNETEIVRTWSQLVSRGAEGFRRSVESRVSGQRRVLAAREARAREAARAGVVLEAARLRELEREAREEWRLLVLMRRMLSALRPR